jgi:hypothetical protein
MIDIFEIGTIKRLPLETSYVNVVAIVHALLLRCPAGTELVIDGTGVGKPVADIFKWHGVTPTTGIEQTIDTAARTANVPKLVLISRIQSLLFVRGPIEGPRPDRGSAGIPRGTARLPRRIFGFWPHDVLSGISGTNTIIAASSVDGGPQPPAPSLSRHAATAAALTMSSCFPALALYGRRAVKARSRVPSGKRVC